MKLSGGQKAIVTVGAFIITFITICTIFRGDIRFLITSRTIERKYGSLEVNSYYLEDNYDYVDQYELTAVHSKKEIIDSIYYLLNSGSVTTKRYCAKEYENCYQDMEEVSKDSDMLSLLNNYVHPFNSFDSIVFNFDNNVIEIKLEHTYTNEEINLLNKRVDEIIQNNITTNMTVKEKIKIIHDYIINHTAYDQLKTKNVHDTTYKSNTAYGVLVEGYGICSGYSDAMKLFLDKFNIINYKISNDQHIWNLVYLDGEWYHLDLTWDDPVSTKNVTRDNYFLITTDTLKALGDDVHYFDKNIFTEVKN